MNPRREMTAVIVRDVRITEIQFGFIFLTEPNRTELIPN